MKFLNKAKALEKNPLLRLLMLFLIVTLLLFLLSDMILHHYQIGLSLSQATETIVGNEEDFTEPMLFDTLLEHVHIDLFSSMTTLMLLAVIWIRLHPLKKQYLIHLAFLSLIGTQMALLSSFYTSFAIPLWIGLFLLWHGVAFYMGSTSIWRLYR